jgi:phosphoserine phosphatase
VRTCSARSLADQIRSGEGVVACDADGTLWTGDVGEDFFFHVLEHEALLEPAIAGARAMARAHGIEAKDGRDTFDALYRAYRAHALPEELACELMAWCVAGRDRKSVREIARRVHRPGEMQGRLIPETQRVLEVASEVWIVSASPAPVVEAALESIGRDPSRSVALEVAWENDVMKPEPIRPIPYAEGKVTNLRARIGARPILAALGDSAFDLPMLAAARFGIAVRPKRALRESAPETIIELRME